MKTKLIKNFRTEHHVLTEHLTDEEFQGNINVKIIVPLTAFQGTEGNFTDYILNKIAGSDTTKTLNDMTSTLVGRVPKSNNVILRIQGVAEER